MFIKEIPMGTNSNAKSVAHQTAEDLAKKAWADKALGFKIFGVVFGIYVAGSVLCSVTDVIFSILNIIVQFSVIHWLLTLIILLTLTATIWWLWRRSAPREVTTKGG